MPGSVAFADEDVGLDSSGFVDAPAAWSNALAAAITEPVRKSIEAELEPQLQLRIKQV
jgi:sulfur relay (sulfurtransferase) DsrC/TusE family protein